MKLQFDDQAHKKATNLSINSDLLAKSRGMKINLSALLEAALKEKIASAENENWKQNNKLAIKAHNSFVEEQGCFGDSMRDF